MVKINPRRHEWDLTYGVFARRGVEINGLAHASAALTRTVRRAYLTLSKVYGSALLAVGDVAAYLELASEILRAGLEINDIEWQANAYFFL